MIFLLGKKLNYGDTIGVISPSSPEKPESIQKGLDFITKLGFKIKVGKHINDKYGYLAGSDTDRAQDIMDMFLDKDVDMILCMRGGYGSMRTLPYLDFNVIKSNPKIFVGFSDITAYLNSFYSKTGLITFHGPMASSNLEDEYTLKSFLDTLTKENNGYSIKNPPEISLKCHNNGTATGKLVGGNLSLISNTVGTPYEVDFKDNILFIEDVHEEPYAIDRMLTHLLLAGKLQQCSGFILGQFTRCSLPHYERSLTLEQVIEDRILNLNKPTITNLMSGHDYPKLTLPIGAKTRIDCDNATIDVLESVIK